LWQDGPEVGNRSYASSWTLGKLARAGRIPATHRMPGELLVDQAADEAVIRQAG
jgi:hypothetical protein